MSTSLNLPLIPTGSRWFCRYHRNNPKSSPKTENKLSTVLNNHDDLRKIPLLWKIANSNNNNANDLHQNIAKHKLLAYYGWQDHYYIVHKIKLLFKCIWFVLCFYKSKMTNICYERSVTTSCYKHLHPNPLLKGKGSSTNKFVKISAYAHHCKSVFARAWIQHLKLQVLHIYTLHSNVKHKLLKHKPQNRKYLL